MNIQKMFGAALAAVLVFSLSACSKEDVDSAKNKVSETAEAVAAKTEEAAEAAGDMASDAADSGSDMAVCCGCYRRRDGRCSEATGERWLDAGDGSWRCSRLRRRYG